MKLIHEFDSLFRQLAPSFAQDRSFQRARTLAFSQLVTFGRRTISRQICSQAEAAGDWSADYKFFSRAKWQPAALFATVLQESARHSHWAHDAIVIAMDDTAIPKTGKKIAPVRTLRDPMSLPYHVNLIRAIRYIQVSIITNPDENLALARAIPIRFEEAAPAPKPPKNAPADVKAHYRKTLKTQNLSTQGRDAILATRQQIDQLPGGPQRLMFTAVDGSYCNRNFLRNLPANIIPIARARKDMAIYEPAAKNPPWAVLVASLLVLASLRAYGATRTNDYFPLPHWRHQKTRRPSMLDLVAQFRFEITKEQLQMELDFNNATPKKKTKPAQKPRSRIEARKRGFVSNSPPLTTHPKLPVNILKALIYADC
ncbi:transposase [candidate division KSB1 bacterium]|nr:transposase [candidate division KSB1 bacterium]